MNIFSKIWFKIVTIMLVPLAAFALASNLPIKMQATRLHYLCGQGKKLTVTYVDYNKNQGMFVVIHYNNQDIGLAQAISASGARYASLYGPSSQDHGLEWWTKGNEGRLSAFSGKDFWDTKTLLANCKTK